MKHARSYLLLLLLASGLLSAQSINVTVTGVGIGTSTPTQAFEVNGNTKNTGEIMSILTAPGVAQFRAVSGPYGCLIRNDGTDTYVLLTNAGDQYGGWNSLRPLRINNATGSVFVNEVRVNPPHVKRIQIAGSVDDDVAISVGGIPFVYTGTSSQAVNYDIQFNAGTCMWQVATNNRNNAYRGDGLRAGVGYMFAGSERLTFTPMNHGGGYASNLTYTITYSDNTVVSKNVNGWYDVQLCNKILYYATNENNAGSNFRNSVTPVP